MLKAAQADDASADEFAAQWQALNQTAAGAEAAAQKIDESLSANEANAMLAWRASLPERATVDDLLTQARLYNAPMVSLIVASWIMRNAGW